jgi:glycine oxidase
MPVKEFEYVVVGGGLAGRLTAWCLARRGRTVALVDDPVIPSASRIAAGMLTPVTGRRMAPSWNLERCLPVALGRYAEIGRDIGASLFTRAPILRIFTDAEEAAQWTARSTDLNVARYVATAGPGDFDGLPLRAPFGGVQISHGGILNVPALLDAIDRSGSGRMDHVRDPCHVEAARQTIYCEGIRILQNPLFEPLALEHAKGEILTLRIPDLPARVVTSRGLYVVPKDNGLFRAGATYDWDDLDPTPTAAGRRALLRRLDRILTCPCEVVEHQAAIRLTTRRRTPVAGRFPVPGNTAILNGLGSKGVLWAPWCADRLVEHLEDGAPLPPDIDPLTHRVRS